MAQVDEPPRFSVEPLTRLAVFPPGDRLVALGRRRGCCGFDRSLEDARLAAELLNHPSPRLS
jgi:hypothetical protein